MLPISLYQQVILIKGLTYSSIKGPSGNIEYLVWLSTESDGIVPDIENIVNEAFDTLN